MIKISVIVKNGQNTRGFIFMHNVLKYDKAQEFFETNLNFMKWICFYETIDDNRIC